MSVIYIGIGSNLGNRAENIKKSIGMLKKFSKIIKISPLYSTEPVGYANQGWFLNCVVKIQSAQGASKLLLKLKEIEKKLKRKKTLRFGPRTIDMDIIFYGNKVIKKKNLIVPHPRMHERLFVLEPLSKISPNFIHPKLKKSVKELKGMVKDKSKVLLYRKKI